MFLVIIKIYNSYSSDVLLVDNVCLNFSLDWPLNILRYMLYKLL